MPGLRDIAPLTKDVVIRGDAYAVRGLSIATIAGVLGRSSELEKALAGGIKFDFRQILSIMPETSRELVEKALGAESEEDRQGVANLTAGEQITVIETAWEVSFPNGLGRLGEWAMNLYQAGRSSNDAPGSTSSPRLMN